MLLSFSSDRENSFSKEISILLRGLHAISEGSGIEDTMSVLSQTFHSIIDFEQLLIMQGEGNVYETIYTEHFELKNFVLGNSNLIKRIVENEETIVLYDANILSDVSVLPPKIKKLFNSVLITTIITRETTFLVFFISSEFFKINLDTRKKILRYFPLIYLAIQYGCFSTLLTDEIDKKTSQFKKSISKIQRFMEISNFAFWSTDHEGFIQPETLGFKLSQHLKNIHEELQHHNIFELKCLNDDQNKHTSEESIQELFNNRKDIYKYITPIKLKGTEYFISIQGQPNYDENNNFIGYIGMFYDISEEVRVNQTLEGAKRISDEVSRSKTQFLAMMSHEIKTPMQAIVGILDLLELTELSEEQRNLIKHVTHSANLLQTLLKDVLDYSRMGSNEMKLEELEFSIRFVMSSIVKQMMPKAKEQGIELVLDVSDNFPNFIIGDQTRLSQVIFNLIGNAIKFTQLGEVRLKAFVQKNKTMRFEISDTGIGISPEKCQILFHPFRQVDATMTRRFGGTGLGLAICRKIIELMNGQIGVESELGKGSTFWFVLPMLIPSSQSLISVRSVVKTNDKDLTERHYNILLAEDSKVNQFIIKKMLENIGHTVKTVDNGKEAVEAVEKEEPDLILMDLQMPEMDGIEASKRIIKYHPKLVILALTANASQTERIECRDAGMIDIVSKPVTIASLKTMFSTFRATINMSIADKKK